MALAMGGSPSAWVSAIVLAVVGLGLAVSTHGFFLRRPHEAASVQRDMSASDTTMRPKWGEEDAALGGPRHCETTSRDCPGLPAVPQELLKVETPVAKPWPEEFIVNFTTNSGAATGFIAYDWSQQRQVVYHGPNSTYCTSYGTDDGCQMFEFSGGTYVYIPSLEQCFLSVEGVGSLPPEWTTNSEFVGVEEVPGVGLCRSFAFPPTVHVWYETVLESLPCLFVFPDPTMSYYFLPETFDVGTPDEKYFDFPEYCFSDGTTAIKQVV